MHPVTNVALANKFKLSFRGQLWVFIADTGDSCKYKGRLVGPENKPTDDDTVSLEVCDVSLQVVEDGKAFRRAESGVLVERVLGELPLGLGEAVKTGRDVPQVNLWVVDHSIEDVLDVHDT